MSVQCGARTCGSHLFFLRPAALACTGKRGGRAFVVAAVLHSPTSLFFPPGDVEERQLAELQPVGIEHLDDVIAACELDPRVDIFRQKVAQQPRDLVLAEAWAFRRWKYSGYQDSCSWATVRSTGPIEAEDLSANRKPALQWVGPTDGESV